jgi:hypothetical protein
MHLLSILIPGWRADSRCLPLHAGFINDVLADPFANLAGFMFCRWCFISQRGNDGVGKRLHQLQH